MAHWNGSDASFSLKEYNKGLKKPKTKTKQYHSILHREEQF